LANVHYLDNYGVVIEGDDTVLQIIGDNSGDDNAHLISSSAYYAPSSNPFNYQWLFNHWGPNKNNCFTMRWRVTQNTASSEDPSIYTPDGVLWTQGGGAGKAHDNLIIETNGNIGMGSSLGNTYWTPAHPLHIENGNYVTAGGVWTDTSSIEFKDHVIPLESDVAREIFLDLEPVTFQYKVDTDEKYVGFIAEDVPDLVATKGRKGLSSMDIVGVLTKVIQDQEKTIKRQNEILLQRKNILEDLKLKLNDRF